MAQNSVNNLKISYEAAPVLKCAHLTSANVDRTSREDATKFQIITLSVSHSGEHAVSTDPRPSQGTPSRRTRRLHASRRPAKKIAKKRSKKERMKRKKRRKSWGRSSVHYSERCRRFHPVGGQQEHIREAYHSARVSFGHKAPKLKLPSFYFAFKVTSVTKL